MESWELVVIRLVADSVCKIKNGCLNASSALVAEEAFYLEVLHKSTAVLLTHNMLSDSISMCEEFDNNLIIISCSILIHLTVELGWLRGKQVEVLRGPAAVNEKLFCHATEKILGRLGKV